MTDPVLDPTFIAQGDDGGVYYIAQRGRTIWWYGEDADGQWAHVFRGHQVTPDGTAGRWEGSRIDVPKGLTCGHMGEAWERRSILPRESRFPYIQRTDGTGPSSVLLPGPFGAAPVERVMPGFVGEGVENLTGVWLGDDGGTYYIREVGGTGEIAWVGEHPQAQPGPEEMAGQRWVNVLMGQRNGRLINATWSDVPKGEINSSGSMTLFVVNETHLFAVSKTGGFGGLRWVRTEPLQLSLNWVSLRVRDQQEWFFEADEPYFLALIAVMDGHSVNLVDPSHSRANLTNSFVAPMLRAQVSQGEEIDLGSLPPLELGVRPVRGDRPDRRHTVFAIALRGAEKDESSRAWQENRLDNWITVVGSEMNRRLQSTGEVAFGVDVARWHETFSLWNEDDLFGLDSVGFTHSQLLAMAGTTTRLTFDLRGPDVRYEVTADLSVRGVRGTCTP